MEIYCYRVVFPFGVSVRVSPAIEAEKTGEILPCGALIESTKSLILDGVNYVKLADDKGWVFSMKNDVHVLDLVEVRRPSHTLSITPSSNNHKGESSSLPPSMLVPSSIEKKTISTDPTSSSSIDDERGGFTTSALCPDSKSYNISNSVTSICRTPSPEIVFPPTTPARSIRRNLSQRFLASPNASTNTRSTQNLWKELRLKIRFCKTFADFANLVAQNLPQELQPPAIPEPGPARSAWMATAASMEESDHYVRVKISILTAITRLCVEAFSDVSGLEAHLWVITHLGAANVSHVLRLFDAAAHAQFEHIESLEFRMALLAKLNEVGTQCKVHMMELGRRVDMLPDDLRHFLQRWVIINVHNIIHQDNRMLNYKSLSRESTASVSPQSSNSSSPSSTSQRASSPSSIISSWVPFQEELWSQWNVKSKKIWTDLIVSCTGDLFVENGDESVLKAIESDEKVIMRHKNGNKVDAKERLKQVRNKSENSNSASSHMVLQEGAKRSPYPAASSSHMIQMLQNWWVETQEHTTAVVMDPDYHVPVGL